MSLFLRFRTASEESWFAGSSFFIDTDQQSERSWSSHGRFLSRRKISISIPIARLCVSRWSEASRDMPRMIYYIRLYKNKGTFYKKCTRAIPFHYCFHAPSSQSLISFCALCMNSAEAWNSFFSYSVMCIRMTCVIPCSPIVHGRDMNSSLHTSWWPWRNDFA